MLMPSIWVGFIGTLVTSVLLAPDWYIWAPRYRISDRYDPDFDRRLITGGDHNLSPQYAAESALVHPLRSECAGEDPAADLYAER
jgi:hypothetical protein